MKHLTKFMILSLVLGCGPLERLIDEDSKGDGSETPGDPGSLTPGSKLCWLPLPSSADAPRYKSYKSAWLGSNLFTAGTWFDVPGGPYKSACARFDPTSTSWSTLDCPASADGAFNYDVVGGEQQVALFGSAAAESFVFDARTGERIAVPKPPIFGSEVYLPSGFSYVGTAFTTCQDCIRLATLDLAAQKWILSPTVEFPGGIINPLAWGDDVLVTGRMLEGDSKTALRYVAATGAWESLDFSSAPASSTFASVDSTLYALSAEAARSGDGAAGTPASLSELQLSRWDEALHSWNAIPPTNAYPDAHLAVSRIGEVDGALWLVGDFSEIFRLNGDQFERIAAERPRSGPPIGSNMTWAFDRVALTSESWDGEHLTGHILSTSCDD